MKRIIAVSVCLIGYVGCLLIAFFGPTERTFEEMTGWEPLMWCGGVMFLLIVIAAAFCVAVKGWGGDIQSW